MMQFAGIQKALLSGVLACSAAPHLGGKRLRGRTY